ncbi:MAG: VIT1/CCC1 transporter family protein [Kiritimatiellia bacterium]|nr:VIT1/CCC1 transporter family protein [Kiritimatiellia bacterium]
MYSKAILKRLLRCQRDEITEHHIYLRLARRQKSDVNRQVFQRLAAEERAHYEKWKSCTEREVSPDWIKVHGFLWISRVFGFTFGAKLLEKGEANAKEAYRSLALEVGHAESIMREEEEHETALLGMLDEERLRYVGSIVLGLNDALVELTGALAGLTLVLQNTRLIAITGGITGIAAALSMAASEYLSTKAEGPNRHPIKAALYTGIAYVMTVILLILPYLWATRYTTALLVTLVTALSIIALFNYYISVARDQPFGKRFLEMSTLSLSVAGFSFLVGYALRTLVGVDV